jgi:hypothetical protein
MKGRTLECTAQESKWKETSYDCVSWDQEVIVELNQYQPVKVTYTYVTDNQMSDYTEFEDVGDNQRLNANHFPGALRR